MKERKRTRLKESLGDNGRTNGLSPVFASVLAPGAKTRQIAQVIHFKREENTEEIEFHGFRSQFTLLKDIAPFFPQSQSPQYSMVHPSRWISASLSLHRSFFFLLNMHKLSWNSESTLPTSRNTIIQFSFPFLHSKRHFYGYLLHVFNYSNAGYVVSFHGP